MADIEHSSLDINLKRVDRIYRPGEKVNGVVVVAARAGWMHKGITMRVNGTAKLQLSQRSLGLFESVSSNSQVKPYDLVRTSLEIAPPGRVPDGVTEIPFEFALKVLSGQKMLESYHGVYVNVFYVISCECRRGVMKAPLEREIEFIVEVPSFSSPKVDPRSFSITPESLENIRSSSLSSIPRFKISGKLHRQACPINLPFTGELIVEESEAKVKSIELQLVRSETVRHPESGSGVREATEIQNVQIADGDVTRNLVIPIYMIFPRLFTCPTMSTDDFKVDFEINLIVLFMVFQPAGFHYNIDNLPQDGYIVTENFPIQLHRFR